MVNNSISRCGFIHSAVQCACRIVFGFSHDFRTGISKSKTLLLTLWKIFLRCGLAVMALIPLGTAKTKILRYITLSQPAPHLGPKLAAPRTLRHHDATATQNAAPWPPLPPEPTSLRSTEHPQANFTMTPLSQRKMRCHWLPLPPAPASPSSHTHAVPYQCRNDVKCGVIGCGLH